MPLFGGFTPPAAWQTTAVFFIVCKEKVGTIIIGLYICSANDK